MKRLIFFSVLFILASTIYAQLYFSGENNYGEFLYLSKTKIMDVEIHTIITYYSTVPISSTLYSHYDTYYECIFARSTSSA